MTYRDRADQYIDRASGYASGFLNRLKRSWRIIAAGAVLLLVISFGLLWYALQEPGVKPPVKPVVFQTGAMSTSTLWGRALDGVLVDVSSTRLLPLGVMVENSADAWPLQGPAKANLVFEAPVEGATTRFLLVFDASSTVDEIGPVRSARPYYVQWADALGAEYAHVGGSPDGLSLISSLSKFRDLNEFFNGWAFWRSSHRGAPHNVYTRTELLMQAASKWSYAVKQFASWAYMDPIASSTRPYGDVTRINVPYNGMYQAEWRYDAETNSYTRYQNGSIQQDADGTVVTSTNVVIMLTDAQVLDDIGRLKLRTTGKGKALVFNNGEKHEATWSRVDGEHIRFLTADGLDVPFNRGKTWISVVTSANAFEQVLK
jgi:hypothetical protein